MLAIPLLREARVLGALVVSRKSTGGFRPETVGILQTFAAQSTLAIQNARLFREMLTSARCDRSCSTYSPTVKFTPDGGWIDVRAALADSSVEISVCDTGLGIAPEDQEMVFEEFRQVSIDDARRHEGTGLGLTLARKFVELHGGRIWVKSEIGKGSTFTFILSFLSLANPF